MKIWLLFFVVMPIAFSSCAQIVPLKNVYAFKTEQMPGIIRVNERGQQVSPRSFISYYVYTESIDIIHWQKAWIDDKSYSVTATEITAFPFRVGEDRNNRNVILINHKPGAKLFKCELSLDNNKVSAPKNSRSGKIILKGIYKNKVILKTINKIVDLYVEPSV